MRGQSADQQFGIAALGSVSCEQRRRLPRNRWKDLPEQVHEQRQHGPLSLERGILYISSLMLDLNYVREHLPEVEEKLRQRGMNPQELFGGFRDLDARRRQAITASETLKAERNKKS